MFKSHLFFYRRILVKKMCRIFQSHNVSTKTLAIRDDLMKFCEKTFDLPKYKVISLMVQYPSFQKSDENHLAASLKCLNRIGLENKTVIKNPLLLKIHPQTLQNRNDVLIECGFKNVDIYLLSKYVTVMRRKSILQLKSEKLLPSDTNVWKNLILCFNKSSDLQKHINQHVDESKSLLHIRMCILKLFLKIELKCSEEKCDKILKAYVNLKNKPMIQICNALHFARSILKLPDEKITPHVLLSNADNVEKLISGTKDLAGTDIKRLFKLRPSLLLQNYESYCKIKEIMKEENISEKAQKRCINVFGLKPSTLRQRIREIKSHPILKDFIHNPRILQAVVCLNIVLHRLHILQHANRNCTSLHKLICSEKEFINYIKAFGDKTRGVDITTALKNCFPRDGFLKLYCRHPYWTCIPLNKLMETKDYLLKFFSVDDIYNNCNILLYPLNDIKEQLEIIHGVQNDNLLCTENLFSFNQETHQKINFKIFSNIQILSLIIYNLEKPHRFSGNGIWPKFVDNKK